MPLGIYEGNSAQAALRQMRTQLPLPKRVTAAPNFRPMSIVAKRSPISATTELLSISSLACLRTPGSTGALHLKPCQLIPRTVATKPHTREFIAEWFALSFDGLAAAATTPLKRSDN